MSARIVVFGGPAFSDVQAVRGALNRIVGKRGPIVVVHRDLNPVGHIAEAWAEKRGFGTVSHPPWWQCHEHPVRVVNSAIASLELDGAIGFPGGEDEAHIASELTKNGVAIWRPVKVA